MCLITFAFQQHPRYKLIVAANRDEAYERPTRPAQFWTEHPGVLAGKDLRAGGTWLGINRTGRFSAITNYRDPSIQKNDPPSRGHLVLDFLVQATDPASYLQQVDTKADRYMGFNLLVGTPDSLAYYSNQEQQVRSLQPGIYGLSNHLLDTPWPKVERAKKGIQQAMREGPISEEALFALLADGQPAADEELPDTGIPKEIEKQVSPVFIRGEEYGTRCSTILLVDTEGTVTFEERRFKAGTQEIVDVNRYQFQIRKK